MSYPIQTLSALLDFDKSLMIDQLELLCAINSGSAHLAGLQRMLETLHSLYLPLADEIQIHDFPPSTHITMRGISQQNPAASALLIRKRPHLRRRVLLCGHMDTVYDQDHPLQGMKYLDDNCMNGPGVADMKGGLVVMLHALQAFERHPQAEQLGWDVFINGDEEIGSIASSALLHTIAPHYQAALVYEPAMTAQGMFAKNRKGNGKFTLIAKGKAAHAGRAFTEGRNAICYLAKVITMLDALNGQRQGVTINVGLIAGGSALNMVADQAITKLDIRISTAEDAAWVHQALDNIVQTMHSKDYQLVLQGSFGRPVKIINPPTAALFKRIQTLGKTLNLALDWQDSGGCCDGNNLAQHGLAVIDTLGVRGGAIHSEQEYILLDSLAERSQLSTLLLSDLAQGGLELLS